MMHNKKSDAFRLLDYVTDHGADHDEDCPGDDTCDCSFSGRNAAVNRLVKALLDESAAPPVPDTGKDKPFDLRVADWLTACFGTGIAGDMTERNHRFLEEALELVQTGGCTASEAHQLVDYVYGRPDGEANQEAGGVLLTLAALCMARGINMEQAGEDELRRVWTKIDVIRRKHEAKG